MSELDIVCIGAVNYDYMFHCDAEDLMVDDSKEGNEDLSNAVADVEKDILELILKNKEYSTQIGGSAFITLKVIKHIFPALKGAYVGVCGTPGKFELRYGKSNNLGEELAHLDDREWFFTTEERFDEPNEKAIAKSIVRLYNHTRNCIKIAPCANNTLLERIREKEVQTGQTLAEYLSRARWVHLSSLSDYEQFEEIMRSVIRAKEMNPSLKVSVDPGSEYTMQYQKRLQPLLAHVDYIFLNNSEKKNLGQNTGDTRKDYANICQYFSENTSRPEQTLVIKHDNRHELLRFEDHHCRIRTIRHRKLYHYELNNDTGAGDSFAGGFISGMLCNRINEDLAGPVELGVIAAKGRMRSFDYENPYLNIQKDTESYREKM